MPHQPQFSRRAVLAGGAALATGFTPLHALGQTSAPLRIAMSLSDIPRMWAGPDAGFEGLRFGGYLVYDALVHWDLSKADQPSRLIPGLAESWRVDPADRRRWIFTLRQGVKFHDGTPFDADAAIWNFASVFDQSAPQFHAPRVGLIRSRLSSVASYAKIDDRTIAVTTDAPDGMFAYQMSFLLFASPARWRELNGDWQRFAASPSGTGAYKVTAFVPRERLEMEPNAEYWDRSRIPRAPRTVLVPIPEGNARVAALRSGQVDIIESVPPDTIQSIRASGARVELNSYPHIWAWRLNTRQGSPFSDVRIRKAANLAINRAEMAELLVGTAAPAKGKVLPGDPWFGRPTFDIGYDPDAAKRLVAEAGYGPNRPVELKVVIASGGGGQMLPLPMNELIQENLAAVGMRVSYDIVDFGTIINMMRQGAAAEAQRQYHAINIAIPSIDPTTGWVIYSSALVAPRGVNWGHYSNPAVDAQLVALRNAFEPNAQDAAMAKLHELLVDDAAALFVVHDLNPRALSARATGFVQARNWFQDYAPTVVR
jgi:peptide/nickel transport system substrate-binding protein